MRPWGQGVEEARNRCNADDADLAEIAQMLSFAPGGANAGYGLSLSAPTTNPRHWWARVRWGGGLDVVEAGQGEGDGEEAVEDLAEVAADGGGGGAAEHDRCRLG